MPLQSEGSARPEDLLGAYAEVSAIFKVGTAAICLRMRRSRDVVALSRFADGMAVAGQIIDDLEDVEEDLHRGRLNYVARRLLAGHPAEPPAEAIRLVARELVSGGGATRILAEAARYLAQASAALEGVDCAPARAQVAWSSAALVRLETAFHRASVRLVLGPLLAAQPTA